MNDFDEWKIKQDIKTLQILVKRLEERINTLENSNVRCET